jgi:hypothetical protein
MAKQIAKLLKSTIGDTSDLKQIAKDLAKKGRGGDSMLAHITPKEAELLKSAGGAGTINPDTGLLEFYDGEGGDFTPSYSFRDPDFYAPTPSSYSYDVETRPSSSYQPSQYGTDPFKGGYTTTPVETYTPPQFLPGYGVPRYQSAAERAGIGSDVPGAINLTGLSDLAAGRLPTSGVAPTPVTPGVQTPAADQSYFEKLKNKITSPETLERLGLAGIGALPGIYAARQAAKQGKMAKQELQQLAAPYQTEGKRLLEQAQRGELTAPAQQQIQAMQARAAQGVAARGGVGAEQAAAQVEAFRQQLLANQYDLGLKVSGIGDQIATGAIRTGLQSDAYVNELTSNYYANLFRDIGGLGQPAVPATQQPRG